MYIMHTIKSVFLAIIIGTGNCIEKYQYHTKIRALKKSLVDTDVGTQW